jgi:lactate dehydrogenase-like 2-hydroxyacid dehydrogenase
VKDSVLGIIGLGRIGKTIAKRAEAFGMQIAYTGRRKQEGQPYDFYPEGTRRGL